MRYSKSKKHTRRNYLKGSVTTVGFAGLTGCLGDGSDGDNPFKIGLLTDLSGPTSADGKRLQQGAEMGIRDFNEMEGGVQGEDVELAVGDTESDPAEGVVATEELIERDNVDALLGSLSSAVALSTASVADDKDMLYLNGSSSKESQTGSCYPWVYPVNNPPQTLVSPIPYCEENLGSESIYFIVSDYTFGRSTHNACVETSEERGLEIEGETMVSFGERDFSDAITAAMDSGADMLSLPGLWAEDAVQILTQLHDFGAKEEFDAIIQNLGLFTVWDGLEDDAIKGIYTSQPWYHRLDNTKHDFSARYEDEYGVPPSFTDATVGYDSIWPLLDLAKEHDGDTEAIATDLEGYEYEYVTGGDAHFRECDHVRVGPTFVLQGKAPEDRNDPLDYLEVMESYESEAFEPDCSDECNLPAWQ